MPKKLDFKTLFCTELEELLKQLMVIVYAFEPEDLKNSFESIPESVRREFDGHFGSPLKCIEFPFAPNWMTNQHPNALIQQGREKRFEHWFLEKQKTHFLGSRRDWEEFVTRDLKEV